MKQNFINTPTPRQQKERLLWFIGTCFGAALTIIILGSLQLIQVHKLLQAKKIYAQGAQKAIEFNELVTRKQELKQEITCLQTPLKKLEDAQKMNQIFAHTVQLITSLFPEESIQRIELKKNSIELSYLSPLLDNLHTYIPALKKDIFCTHARVQSIAHDNKTGQYAITLVIQFPEKTHP